MAVGHTDAIRAMAVHGRTVITASYDRSVRVWDVIDGSAKKVLMGHTDKGQSHYAMDMTELMSSV